MPEITFDAATAASYDEHSAERFDPAVLDPTVDFLAGLAADGRALEFGVGTGRVALPLSRRGVQVHGIDISVPMVEKLREKDGGNRVATTIGDFATTRVPGQFRLAYLVFNTISNLTTQDEQVACFHNAAEHLEPGGWFVIELFVPILQRIPRGEVHHVFHHSADRVSFDDYDVATQILHSHHFFFNGERYTTHSAPYRYAWPAELDLMARLAGLELSARYNDWDRSPFTRDSEGHVSVWRKPA